MKRIFALSLLSLAFLTACQPQNQGTTSSSSSQTLSSSEIQKKLEERLTILNQTDMPQLSTEVADHEAAVKLKTSKGDITIKLFPELAPLAVENFLTHAKAGYYKDVTFHRVIAGFMIQGGDPEGTGRGGQSIWAGKNAAIDKGSGFPNEVSDLLYNIRGSLAMANAGPDTNGSQFFINQNQDDQSGKLHPLYYPESIIEAYTKGGNPSLDGGYTVFGQVIEGMDIVDSIAAVKTDDQDKPLEPVTITAVEVIKDYTFD